MPGDKGYKLKHCIKDPEIPLAAISLGNNFAVEETIDPSRYHGWFVPLIIFPQDVLHQSRTGQKSSPWRWGRKERKNLTENTNFLSTERSGSMKGVKTCSVVFYWWIPALTSKMKFLFCSFLENVGIWDFWVIFCLGLLIQLSWIKIRCHSSCGGEGDWTWFLTWVLSFRGPYGIKKSECKENSGQQETG